METDQGRHQLALDFSQRLRASNCVVVYSSLIFIEAPQCWRRMYARGLFVSNEPSGDVVSDRINAFKKADNLLSELLASFRRRRIAITGRLMSAASRLVAVFNLKAHDALVVAIAREIGIPDIASFDRDFRRVDEIELWDGPLPP